MTLVVLLTVVWVGLFTFTYHALRPTGKHARSPWQRITHELDALRHRGARRP